MPYQQGVISLNIVLKKFSKFIWVSISIYEFPCGFHSLMIETYFFIDELIPFTNFKFVFSCNYQNPMNKPSMILKLVVHII